MGGLTIMTTGGNPWGKMETRELTDAERAAFIADVRIGILAFAGDKPYAVPLGSMYAKGTVLIDMAGTSGEKWDYVNKSRTVCWVMWQFGKDSNVPSLKEQMYTSVILKGELEEVTDDKLSYYELPPKAEGSSVVWFALKTSSVGTQTVKIGK
jgi:nitroimidazol reductase NimA-like FMN-containing flavoprotein (pyridoxamine 5'-phosphate oxidase superfamily)